MKSRFVILMLVSMTSALISTPAHLHGQATAAGQHEHHADPAPPAQSATPPGATPGTHSQMMGMMNRMRADDATLDGLVKKMNAATGPARIDAMAALLTALVEGRRAEHETMMAHMTPMMCPMHESMMGGGTAGWNDKPEK